MNCFFHPDESRVALSLVVRFRSNPRSLPSFSPFSSFTDLDRTLQLGILSSSSPILITRPFSGSVPRGTNGGITLWGLFVSWLGGAWVGVLAITTLLVQGQARTCEEGWWIGVMGVAASAGLGGSLVSNEKSLSLSRTPEGN